jgi:hypothetical protein
MKEVLKKRDFCFRRIHAFLLATGIIGSVIALSTTSCQRKTYEGLATYPDIRVIFTKREIQDLTTILSFFEHQICDMLQVRSDSVADCYQALFRNMERTQKSGFLYVPVQFDAQEEMYAQLDSTMFTEVWLKGTGINQETGDTVVRISLNHEGKYAQFLDSLKTDYPVLTAYINSFKSERKVTPKMIDSVLFDYRLLDMSDLRMRLFIALHYLTINDTSVRRNQSG